jgi:GntR family transcriptional repressor for pyruvate dehydrogenase complex
MQQTRITPAPRVSLTDHVAQSLARAIAAGEVPPGTKLPPEHALCLRYGVSRTVVREAISRLRSDGLVQARQGVGVFVLDDHGRRPFRITGGEELSSREIIRITELRMAFDVQASVLAASRRTAADVHKLRAALGEMRRALDSGELGDAADLAFHRAVAAATGNPLYVSFFAFLEPHVLKAIRVSRQRSRRQPGVAQRVHEEHERLAEAIVARNPERAGMIARRLIESTLRRLDPGSQRGPRKAERRRQPSGT